MAKKRTGIALSAMGAALGRAATKSKARRDDRAFRILNFLRHYLSRHREIGDNAIAKLIAWYDGQAEGAK